MVNATPHPRLHVAIIPDGNRRWARNRGLPEWKGHEKAAGNVRHIIEWSRKDPRVGVLTLWFFSTENWKRDKAFSRKLMSLLEKYLREEWEKFVEHGIRFVTSGRKDRLPHSLASLIEEVTERTGEGKELVLHIALDYGGKDEIVRAVRQLAASDRNPDAFTEESIRAHVDRPELPDIDLIIRTSGETRTSNFFLWQSAYAEWVFHPSFFPDFGPAELEESIRELQSRKRRFGS